MQDEHLAAARRQAADGLLDLVDGLAGGHHPLAIDIVGIGRDLPGLLRVRGVRFVAAPAIDRPMDRQMPQERQRRTDRLRRRAVQQLHADILDDIAGERPVTETVPDMIDQLLVMIDEGSH